jgi:hypothetical protein
MLSVLSALAATSPNNRTWKWCFLCDPCQGYVTRTSCHYETTVRRVEGWYEMSASARRHENGTRYQAAQWRPRLKTTVFVWWCFVKCSHELYVEVSSKPSYQSKHRLQFLDGLTVATWRTREVVCGTDTRDITFRVPKCWVALENCALLFGWYFCRMQVSFYSYGDKKKLWT